MSVVNGIVDLSALDATGALVCVGCGVQYRYAPSVRIRMLPLDWGTVHAPSNPKCTPGPCACAVWRPEKVKADDD